jgi:Ca2+-binding EF-hand superfamily protein
MSIGAVGGGSQMLRSFMPPSFSSLDGNGNGGLSLDELKSAGPGKAGGAKSDERLQKLFEAMDTDGSGEVSSTEKDVFDSKVAEARQAVQFMAQQFAGMPPSSDDIFAATDKDSSGEISIEEFSSSDTAEGMSTEALEKLFSAIDGNGNGSITEDESSAFLDGLGQVAGGPPPMGGPGGPKGPPPGGPPPGGSSREEDEESPSRTAADLLSAATQAYSSTSRSNDLLSVLTSILDEAA